MRPALLMACHGFLAQHPYLSCFILLSLGACIGFMGCAVLAAGEER